MIRVFCHYVGDDVLAERLVAASGQQPVGRGTLGGDIRDLEWHCDSPVDAIALFSGILRKSWGYVKLDIHVRT